MVRLTCEACNKDFYRIQRKSHGGNPKRFCSPKCRYQTMRGEKHPNFTGGRYVPKSKREYITILKPGHPRAHHGRVKEHILVAEEKFGGFLPEGAEVHHENGDTKDNRPENLTICFSRKEHSVLEAKARQLKDTGSLDLKRCKTCKIVKPLVEFHNNKNTWDRKTRICKECACARTRAYNRRSKNVRRVGF